MTDTPVESYQSRLMREVNATVALANDGFGSRRAPPRYLTAEGKRHELALWEATKRESTPPPHLASHPGGYGYPDPSIFTACDQLNALDGVCTLQSCSGHWSHEYPGNDGRPMRCPWAGEFWLWLSEPVARRFYGRIFELANNPLIETVRILAQSYGQEVYDIQFQGEAHGKLQESVECIVKFMGSLVSNSEPDTGATKREAVEPSDV